MDRRSFVAALGSLPVAGCIGSASREAGPPGDAQSDDSECDDDVVRLPVDLDEEYDVRTAEARGLALTASPSTVQIAGDVTFALVNDTNDAATTGTRDKYTIQRLTDDGWEHVFRVPADPFVLYEDVGIQHDPGEVFEWTFTLRREALETDAYRVCSPVTAGTYRFVYFGLPGAENPAVAREFEVRDR